LFANHFADVILGHAEFDDNRVFAFDTSHLDLFGFLNDGLGNLLDEFFH
jgi:hypothetical protein